MKKLLYLLLLIALIIALSFDALFKSVLETMASKAMKTEVSISQLKTDFAKQQLNLDFIEVKNSPAFKNDNALSVGHIIGRVGDNNSQVLNIETLQFDDILFTLEQNRNQVNLVELFKQLEQNQTSQSIDTDSESGVVSHKDEKRVLINDLSFTRVKVYIDSELVNGVFDVPDITIRDFGAPKGVAVDQISTELMRLVLIEVQKQVEDQGLKLTEESIKAGIRKQLQNELDSLKGEIGDKAKNWIKQLGL